MTAPVTHSLTPTVMDRLLTVVDHVAGLYGIPRDELLLGTRHQCAEARRVLTYAGLFGLDLSLTQIALALGTRHRARLGSGYHQLVREMRVDSRLRDRVLAVAAFAHRLASPEPEVRTA